MDKKKNLIKIFSLVTFALMMVVPKIVAAETQIMGTWLDDKGESKTRIFKTTAGDYAGKIVWLKKALDANGNFLLDKNNPVKTLRTKKLLGETIVFKGITYDAKENNWICSYAYSPELGMVGKGKIWFEGTRLYVKAKKFGFGKTRSFTRVR